MRREVRVDAPIPAQIAPHEFRQIEPVVQDRPEHTIGKAIVVFLVVRLRKIADDVCQAAMLYGRRGVVIVAGDFSAPPEPDAGILFQQGAHGDRKTARLVCTAAGRDRHAVGYDNQPRQYRSSQLRDRRIAVRMSPAIE